MLFFKVTICVVTEMVAVEAELKKGTGPWAFITIKVSGTEDVKHYELDRQTSFNCKRMHQNVFNTEQYKLIKFNNNKILIN